MNNDLTLFFNNCGILVNRIDKGDALRLWRDLFCDNITAEMKAQTPNYNEEFNWHIFSFGLVQAAEGNSAKEVFEERCRESGMLYRVDDCFRYLKEFPADEQLSLF